MKPLVLIVLFGLGLFLAGCTQTKSAPQTYVPVAIETQYVASTPTPLATAVINQSLQPPAATPIPPKLDAQALSRYLLQFTDAPHWVSWCKTSCNGLRYVIQDAVCTPAKPDEYRNPLFSIVNDSVLRVMANASKQDVQDACFKVVPDVIFDCDAFAQGTLSCGKGLTGCQDGGFHLQFNRTRLLAETGWESDTQVFIDTHAFKKLMGRDDCQKPA
ncbi:hypothetical protein HYV43_07085 [Candidatus Micrarchaeota archaeon]|nr:hypothetical protein [Candidatus Micrarchaeota archaeon]